MVRHNFLPIKILSSSESIQDFNEYEQLLESKEAFR